VDDDDGEAIGRGKGTGGVLSCIERGPWRRRYTIGDWERCRCGSIESRRDDSGVVVDILG
jgi:hypothetical protein